MNGILTLALKDLRLLLRDRASLFWVLVWPLVNGLVFGSIMGGVGPRPGGGMRVAVVDEDSSAASRAYVERLRESDALRVHETTLDSARTLVRRGERVGFVRIPEGYGAQGGFGGGSAAAPLEIGMDPSRTAEKGYLEGLLMQASFEGIQEQFADPDSMRSMVRDGLGSVEGDTAMAPAERAKVKKFLTSLDEYLGTVDTSTYRQGGMGFSGQQIKSTSVLREGTRPRSGFEVSFPIAIMWALVGCAAGFAISLVNERVYGTFMRLRTTPLSRADVLAGKGLACFLASLGVVALLLAIGGGFMGVRLGNPVGLAAAVLCTAFCYTGIMMFISALGENPRAVSGAGWAILLGTSMIGGGMIPLIAMPPWMQAASHASPVRWGILALEGAIWRGFSAAEMLVPCAILIGVGGLGFAAGVLMSRRWQV